MDKKPKAADLPAANNERILISILETARIVRPQRAAHVALASRLDGGHAMTIAPKLQNYLDQNVTYDLIPHEPTMTSIRTAEACRIPDDCLAKGIVLRRDAGYVLAVLPASHHIHFPDLKRQLGEDVSLASEDEIAQLFLDCARGAVPPIGNCYGLEVVIDESINERPEVYMEAGDHSTLVHMGHAQFAQLTADAQRGRFSVRV
jgi:Ala-tRNA(Pro) deacylase